MNKSRSFMIATLMCVCISVMCMGAASAASLSQCQKWSDESDKTTDGYCRNSYIKGKMKKGSKLAKKCCNHRKKTIRDWKKCTKWFGPLDWTSLNQSKREWGCR